MFAVTGCSTFTRHVISLMKPAFFGLGFRGPDCNVIAEQVGGPDARPSWAGSGPRAGCCRPWNFKRSSLVTIASFCKIGPTCLRVGNLYSAAYHTNVL